MLFFIIFGILLLISIVVLVISYIKYNRNYFEYADIFNISRILMFVFFATILIFSIVCIARNSTAETREIKAYYESQIQELNADYNLIMTIENDYARSVAAVQYNEKVTKFRWKIKFHQSNANSLWFNWFVNEIWLEYDYTSIKYIGAD